MHWIDEDFAIQNLLLSFLPLDGPHSADAILETFLRTVNKYNIADKISCVTLDNASANISFTEKLEKLDDIPYSFFKSLETNHVRCLAHVFHLAAQALIVHFEQMDLEPDLPLETFLQKENVYDEIVSEEFIKELEGLHISPRPKEKEPEIVILRPIARLRKFLFTIKMNSTKKLTLKVLQARHNIKQTKPVIDVKTRWNSTYDMLEWALENRIPLIELMQEAKIIFKQWNSLTILFGYLSIFNQVTSLVASQNSVSIGLALISVERLARKLEAGLQNPDTPTCIREALEKAYEKIQKYRYKYHTKLYLVATHKKEFDNVSY